MPSPQGISVVPAEAYIYQDKNMPRPIEATDEVSLAQALRDYRIANGIPVGDPATDVAVSIASRLPQYHEPPPHAVSIINPKTLRDRVTSWLSERFAGAHAGALQLVSDEEANRRAEICARCPRNQEWRHGCPPCVNNNERIVLLMTQGQFTGFRQVLNACEVFGHELNSAVKLDKKHLNDSGKEEAPPQCWMREEK